MEKYKFVDDLTSDVMFEAYGRDVKEVFENSAEAMFSVICRVKDVAQRKIVKVEVSGNGPEDLLINWLQELIALVDTEGMFFSKFEIIEIGDNGLTARIYGEPMRPEKGETVVKAVTYYKFALEATQFGYKATVSLDI